MPTLILAVGFGSREQWNSVFSERSLIYSLISTHATVEERCDSIQFLSSPVTIAFSKTKSDTLFIYLKVTEARAARELFITFSSPYMIFLCLPVMQMDCRCRCLLWALPKCIPHKTINHCIPSRQVMHTSVTKWAREERKKKCLSPCGEQ